MGDDHPDKEVVKNRKRHLKCRTVSYEIEIVDAYRC